LEEYWRDLRELGCTYEIAELGFNLLAVDVPDSTLLERVYQALTRGGEAGIWDFEEGNVHLPKPRDKVPH
jgi:hypothetical protein